MFFLFSSYDLVTAQITNHGGANWTISSNQTATGTHINVGIFQVDAGDTLFVSGNELNVEALSVNITGVISANGRGGVGGVGPIVGGGPSNTNPGCSGGIAGTAAALVPGAGIAPAGIMAILAIFHMRLKTKRTKTSAKFLLATPKPFFSASNMPIVFPL